MAACESEAVMSARIKKNLIISLKNNNPELKIAQINRMAQEATDGIIAKVKANTKVDVVKPSIVAAKQASKAPKEITKFTVPGNVILAQEMVKKDNTYANRKQLLNIEMAAGMRDDKGKLIVDPVYPTSTVDAIKKGLASDERQLDVPMTHEETSDFYYDEDGSMSNADNVNNALKELDAKNLGDDLDQDWSAQLDKMLNDITDLVGDISKAELKVTKSDLSKAAGGTFDPNTGEIVIKIDNLGNGQDARNRFTMTNQEVYLHELVHSVVDYVFEPDVLKAGKNTDLVNMVSEAKRLYTLAGKNTSWEDLLVNVKNPTKHEVEQAKVRYEYIFNNKYGNGLHEFMAHLLTNKQFGEAMDTIDAGFQGKDPRTAARKAADIKAGKSIAREDVADSAVMRITELFRNVLNKILGFATAKDGSVTEAGSKLIFDIIKANNKAADKVSVKQAPSIGKKSTDFIEEQLQKLGKQLDKGDKKLQEPIDKALKAIMGQLDTRSAKKRFKREYEKQKASFFRRKGAKTPEAKQAIEEQADKAATAKAEQVLQDEATKIAADIDKAMEAIQEDAAKPKTVSNIYGVETMKLLSKFPRRLALLYKLHKVSRGVYGEALAGKFAEEYKNLAEELNFFEDSLMANILEDFYERDDLYNEITDAILALTHTVDGYREKMYEGTLSDIAGMFGDIDITHADNRGYDAAMSHVILRTDLQALGIDAKGLLGLISTPGRITKKIADLKAKLTPQQIKDAQSTASSMVNGIGTISNATNIARGFGQEKVNMGDVDTKLVANIDKLISLMALDMAEDSDKQTMQAFLSGDGYDAYKARMEKRLGSKLKLTKGAILSRGEYNAQVTFGVDNFIAYSKGMQEASAKEMELEPHNIIKGYMKETYDSNTDVEYFPVDQIKEREREGYVYVRKVGKQTEDGPVYALFTVKDSAVKRANGALGLQGTRQRGTTLADIVNRDNPASDNENKTKIFKKELEKAKKRYAKGDEKLGMYPIYNKVGRIVNFRSTMSSDEKHELLDMEVRGTQNLSRSYGTSSTARKTERHNRTILGRLRKDFDENYVGNEDEYVTIEPDMIDAMEAFGIESIVEKDTEAEGYARMWARLPKSTKEAAAEMFGEPIGGGKPGYKNGKIIVRKDLLMPLFGYDEVTITDMENANKWSTATRRRAKTFEKAFQDIMQIAKGNIVIKTTDVLIGNITSNAKILGYVGVNPVKGMKLLLLGRKELERYENDAKELAQLNRQKLSGLKVSDRRITELEKDLEENSVAPLIEAGLYQSVVEDVSTKTDNNRVSNWFNTKRDEYIPNETVNTAVQYAFLTEKTKPFQMMLKATQVSDFYFRYAQYHDAIDNKGQTKEQALRDVTDNYINYEAPLNKYIKYGDRMGPFFFITYFTRIQRVVKRIVKKNPVRVTADILQQFAFGDQDDILDQSVLDASIIGHYNPMKIFKNLWQAVSPSGLEFVGIVSR